MPARTGSNTHLGITLSSTFDTVVAAGSGHKVQVDNINHAKGLTELTESPIGSGLSMQQDTATGDFNPTVSISKTFRDLDQGIALISAFLGKETAAATGSGYVHSISHNAYSITAYANLAFTPDSANCIEYVNGVVTKLGLTVNPNDYVKSTFDLLFTDQKITGTTNTAATLSAASEVSGRQNFIARPAHYVRMNAQGGAALTNSDAIAVTNVEITMSKDMELVGEIRGASGYSAPRFSGSPQFSCDVKLTFKNLQDLTYFTAVNAGTEYKLDIVIQGNLISGSTYRQLELLIPRAIIVTDPDFNVTNPGDNELTITLRALVATSVPSGMFDTYPHVKVTNSRSTTYFNG